VSHFVKKDGVQGDSYSQKFATGFLQNSVSFAEKNKSESALVLS